MCLYMHLYIPPAWCACSAFSGFCSFCAHLQPTNLLLAWSNWLGFGGSGTDQNDFAHTNLFSAALKISVDTEHKVCPCLRVPYYQLAGGMAVLHALCVEIVLTEIM